MFDNLKNHFDQWAVKKRFDQKMSKRKQAHIELEKAICNPDDKKRYNRAIRQLARYQTGQNFLQLGRWMVTGLLWLIVPYLPYSGFEAMLNDAISAPRMTSRALFATQEQLLMMAIVTGVFLLVTVNHLIKRGWYHRPYKKGSVNQTVAEIQAKHHIKAKAEHLKQHTNNKKR